MAGNLGSLPIDSFYDYFTFFPTNSNEFDWGDTDIPFDDGTDHQLSSYTSQEHIPGTGYQYMEPNNLPQNVHPWLQDTYTPGLMSSYPRELRNTFERYDPMLQSGIGAMSPGSTTSQLSLPPVTTQGSPNVLRCLERSCNGRTFRDRWTLQDHNKIHLRRYRRCELCGSKVSERKRDNTRHQASKRCREARMRAENLFSLSNSAKSQSEVSLNQEEKAVAGPSNWAGQALRALTTGGAAIPAQDGPATPAITFRSSNWPEQHTRSPILTGNPIHPPVAPNDSFREQRMSILPSADNFHRRIAFTTPNDRICQNIRPHSHMHTTIPLRTTAANLNNQTGQSVRTLPLNGITGWSTTSAGLNNSNQATISTMDTSSFMWPTLDSPREFDENKATNHGKRKM